MEEDENIHDSGLDCCDAKSARYLQNCNSTFVIPLMDEDENIHDSSYSQVFTTVMQNRLSSSPIAHLPFSFFIDLRILTGTDAASIIGTYVPC